MYDAETALYYLQSRYYAPEIGRFINADDTSNLGANSDFASLNLFAYCGNNPENRVDPLGEEWWHWALGAAVVAACAIVTVITCGGFASAAMALCLVANGVAAATTASTVAAGALIGSATVYGTAVLMSASSSSTIQEFNNQGNWGTVISTTLGGLAGGYYGYSMSKAQNCVVTENESSTSPVHSSGTGSPKNNVNPGGSYTKLDNQGKVYSYSQYDSAGRQTLRIDYQGRPHGGVLPHIHIYVYPQQGGRAEYIFDKNWNLIN